MRTYAELLASERKKLYRIFIFLLCPLQMAALIEHFRHRWSHMEPFTHQLVVLYLIAYPAIALYSLKKQPDPFAISAFAYMLLGLSFSLLILI